MVSAGTQAGKVFRRARIVSEPISNYQKWVLKDSHLYVEAGEDIRCIACPVGDPPKAGTSLGQCRMPPGSYRWRDVGNPCLSLIRSCARSAFVPVLHGWHPASGAARPRTFGSSAGASACTQPGAGAVPDSVVCFTAGGRAATGGRETRSRG
ncbi:MAG: DUF6879 family protein [Pseudonocardiaceae bacterium]